MSARKSYCLKCEKPNLGCKCGNTHFTIYHSHKVRAPLNTNNRVQFRNFLNACPIFINLVPEELKPHFRNLLIKVKYYDIALNGQEWSVVTKKDKLRHDLFDSVPVKTTINQ